MGSIKNYFNRIKDFNHIQYENILEDPNSKLGRYLNYFLYGLVIVFCAVVTIHSVEESLISDYFLFIFDAFISIIFFIEYIYRFFRAKDKLKFFIIPMRIVDLLSFLPFFLGFFIGSQYLTFLRMIKFLRVLKFLKNIPMTSSFLKSISYYKDEFKAILVIYFIILFIGSALVYYAEHDVNGDMFTSIPTALWWGLVTMATVGFGDMVPITPTGKFIGSILVFLGPVIGSVIGAITVLIFMENAKINEKIHGGNFHICIRCRNKNPKKANYCMKCGTEIIKKSVKSKVREV